MDRGEDVIALYTSQAAVATSLGIVSVLPRVGGMPCAVSFLKHHDQDPAREPTSSKHREGRMLGQHVSSLPACSTELEIPRPDRTLGLTNWICFYENLTSRAYGFLPNYSADQPCQAIYGWTWASFYPPSGRDCAHCRARIPRCRSLCERGVGC